MKNTRNWLLLTSLGIVLTAGSALGADEMFRAKLLKNKGDYLVVRTTSGTQREVRLSRKVVVVSREKATTEAGKIVRNSTLLLSLNGGEVTTIVVEEVPK
ncbi:hypothetical protein [Geobacter sp. AOG2]|uniref:hypothetical protein n=1 Tax=Geobacter sp. AOG2 TaxID=1566347 RepID=UPI001CC77E98|nr:hypothetical protein [Geobacter sp. AOG2]GFE61362.1 hypothetical protein AOG2_19490 [Geobacter sp. AOG2]